MEIIERKLEINKQNNPDICPRCGASRSQLKGMISEPPYHPYNPWGMAFDRMVETENHATAIMLLGNCPECKEAIEAWQKRMETIKSKGLNII
jgi:transcription initiation factor IIE alpha subunit